MGGDAAVPAEGRTGERIPGPTRWAIAGRIRAGGIERDVSFEQADAVEPAPIDDAYRAKYGRSPYVDAMVSAEAATTTIRLIPLEPAV